ncbi:MAG TPA: ABC transporter permease [Nocardioides sp.]|nr:ABC transporter permease [Nocardioides sp.]
MSATTSTPVDAGTPDHIGPPRNTSSWGKRIRSALPGLISLVAFIGIWQAAVSLTDPDPLILPGPRAVFDAFVTAVQEGEVWAAVKASAGPLAVGMLFSLLAIPLGLLIGLSPTVDLITSPYLWGFYALPNVAFAPLLILITGFSTTTSIWMVILSAAVPLCLSCKDGVQAVDEGLVRAARSFGGGRVAVFVKVIAPCTLPFIASGVRNAISRGFVGLLSVELLIGTKGTIGGEVIQSLRTYDTARMIAFILLLIVIALVLVSASRRLESYASRWREEVVI